MSRKWKSLSKERFADIEIGTRVKNRMTGQEIIVTKVKGVDSAGLLQIEGREVVPPRPSHTIHWDGQNWNYNGIQQKW